MLNIKYFGGNNDYQGNLIFNILVTSIVTDSTVILRSFFEPSTRIIFSGTIIDFESEIDMSGRINSISYAEAEGTIAEWSGMKWDAAELADAINDMRAMSPGKFRDLLNSQDMTIDASESVDGANPGSLGNNFDKKLTFIGSDFNDKVEGGNGKDNLDGGKGSDKLTGNGKSDVLKGGGGGDDLFGGKGDDTLKGGAGKDDLLGGKGADRLEGGSSADILSGGKGNDKMFGGKGADTFYFAGNSGDDVIRDFQNKKDIMEIEGADFSDLNIEKTGGNTVITWSGNSITLVGETGAINQNDFEFI